MNPKTFGNHVAQMKFQPVDDIKTVVGNLTNADVPKS